MPRILLVRNVFSNIGDEAMLQCDLEDLRTTFPGGALTVLTDDPKRIRCKYGVDARFSDIVLSHPFSDRVIQALRARLTTGEKRSPVLRPLANLCSRITALMCLGICGRLLIWNAHRLREGKAIVGLFPHQRELLQLLATADLVVAGGGLMTSLPSLYRSRTALYRTLAMLKVPVILHGQTIFPRRELVPAYRLAARIILRDHNASPRYAQSCGVEEARLIAGIDPAFDLPVATDDQVMAVLRSLNLDPARERLIAVNVRAWTGHNFRAFPQILAGTIARHCRDHPATAILLFGMQRYRAQDDSVWLKRLERCLKPCCKVRVLDDVTDPPLLKAVLSKAHCVITCRYHGAIFALTQAVPAIGLSTSPECAVKLGGLFDLFGMACFLFPTSILDEEKLYAMLQRLTQQRPALAQTLRVRKEALVSFQSLLGRVCQSVWDSRGGSR